MNSIFKIDNELKSYVTEKYIEKNIEKLSNISIRIDKIWAILFVIKSEVKINYEAEKDLMFDEFIKEEVSNTKNKIRKMKVRWVKDDVTSKDGPLQNEINNIEKLLDLKRTSSEKKDFLKKRYNINSIDKLFENYKKELLYWRDSQESNIIDYKYINRKNKKSIETGIKSDLTLLALDYWFNKHIEESQKRLSLHVENKTNVDILKIPETMKNIPINVGHKEKIKEKDDNLVALKNSNIEQLYFKDSYYVNEEKKHTVLINKDYKDYINKDILKKQNNIATFLNHEDFTTLAFIISEQDANFFANRIITTDINSLAKKIYGRSETYYKNKCIESLYKLSLVKQLNEEREELEDKLNIDEEEFFGIKSAYIYGILDHIEFEKFTDSNLQKNMYVKATVNYRVVQELLSKQTINLYKKEFEKLQKPLSSVLAFHLQSERMMLLDSNYEDYKKININTFFVMYMRKNKVVYRETLKIKEALNEMKKNEFIVKDFFYHENNFFIQFYPVTEQEKEDLAIKPSDIDINRELSIL